MEAQPSAAELQALIVPLKYWNLIVPQSLVIEVLSMPIVHSIEASERWLKGTIEWRGIQVPLASMEAFCKPEEGIDQQNTHRVAVMQGLGDIDHYALEIYSIPHPVRVVESEVQDDEAEESCELIARHVRISGVKGVIPELEVLEQKINEVIG
jgi:chemosensory pili system protein ChpC